MNTNRTYASSAYRVTLAAGLAALALIFSYIEAIIPFNAGMPGVKLGIANLVILVSLYTLGFRYTFAINLVRILVAGLLFNGFFGALYSLAGGILSLFVMYGLKRTGLFSQTGVSMAGGVAHNTGQLLVAAPVSYTHLDVYKRQALTFTQSSCCTNILPHTKSI